ncbi:MAG: carboxypeptidase-like regulatory domain-containing protein [Actinomycetota bacterium]|nr:carboxypeptidase-like regulatory domain-containing protein [Actinomycetota bacterium]
MQRTEGHTKFVLASLVLALSIAASVKVGFGSRDSAKFPIPIDVPHSWGLILGQVTDIDGLPVADATISIADTNGGSPPATLGYLGFPPSSPQGTFEAWVPAGKWMVTAQIAHADGSGHVTASHTVVVRAGKKTDVDLIVREPESHLWHEPNRPL